MLKCHLLAEDALMSCQYVCCCPVVMLVMLVFVIFISKLCRRCYHSNAEIKQVQYNIVQKVASRSLWWVETVSASKTYSKQRGFPVPKNTFFSQRLEYQDGQLVLDSVKLLQNWRNVVAVWMTGLSYAKYWCLIFSVSLTSYHGHLWMLHGNAFDHICLCMHLCLSVCLSCLCSNFWKPQLRNFIYGLPVHLQHV